MRRIALLILVSMLAGIAGEGVASAADRLAPSRVTPKFVRRSKINKDGTTPVLLRWSYSGDMSQVERFILEESVNGGAYDPILRAPILSYEAVLDPNGDTYAFKVRARLLCETCSEPVYSRFSEPRPFELIPYQEESPEITYVGPWTYDSPLAGSWGGEVTYTVKKFAQAFFDFYGTAAAYIGTKGPGYSKYWVTADGIRRGNRGGGARTSFVYRRVIFRYNWGSNGYHQLGIDPNRYNLRVDVDGYVVIRYV
jgi:hypothetical protein